MKDLKKFKIIYLGTPEIAIEPLRKLVGTGFNVVAVFCQPDKESGRGKTIKKPPVKVTAEELGIIAFQPKDKDELKKLITEISPDLAIVFAYGKIIPEDLLDKVPFGFLNIHPSLLPKFRGPSPIKTALLNGETKTGVSIIKLTKEIDSGPIIIKEAIEIDSKDNAITLSKKLSELGAYLIAESTEKILRNDVKFENQNNSEASFTKIIKKEDGKIDWSKSAFDLEKEIKAYSDWPSSYFFWNNKQIKILEASAEENFKKAQEENPKKVVISAGNNTALIIQKLQLEGKKPVTSEEFLMGYPDFKHFKN